MINSAYVTLLSKLPKGDFYVTGVVPFKTGAYQFVLDTLYPLTEYDVRWNVVEYHYITDLSGTLSAEFFVDNGENKIEWRKVGSDVWKWAVVRASNIGTLLGGAAAGLQGADDDVSQVVDDVCITTTGILDVYNYLYGIGYANLTRAQLEEVVHAVWNWTEYEHGIRQISGALDAVPVTIERIGPWVLSQAWIENAKYKDGLDAYEIVGSSNEQVVDSPLVFGKLLEVEGASVLIYPTVRYGMEGVTGDWVYKTWARLVAGSGQIRLGISTDGTTWSWSGWILISNEDIPVLTTSLKPIKVAIEMDGSADFKIQIGWQSLTNEDTRAVLGKYPGRWEGRKPIAVWNWET